VTQVYDFPVYVKLPLVQMSGLPDGMFSYQKSQFGYTFDCQETEKVGTRYGHLDQFTDIYIVYVGIYGQFIHSEIIWNILPKFGMLYREKMWQPWFKSWL
jgi:hypothetical protein